MDQWAKVPMVRAWRQVAGPKGGDDDRCWRLVQLLATLLTVPIGAFGTYLVTTKTDIPVWLVVIAVVVPTWVVLALLVAAILRYLDPPA